MGFGIAAAPGRARQAAAARDHGLISFDVGDRAFQEHDAEDTEPGADTTGGGSRRSFW